MPRHPSQTSSSSRGAKDSARACNTCRARKGKCDGNGVDPCGWCREKRQDCSYNPDDRKKAPWNKQTRESHQELVNGLMTANEALQQEIESMQIYIRQLGGSPPTGHGDPEIMSSDDQAEGSSPSEDPNPNPLAHLVDGPISNSSVSPPSPSPPQRSLSIGNSEYEDVNHRAAIHADDDFWKRHLPVDAVMDAEEHEKIIDLYFKFLCSWIYRHVPQLFWRDMYISMRYGSAEEPIKTSHWSPFLQNAILALGIPISEREDVRCRENREKYAKNALKEIDREFDEPSISSLLGFSTLACYYSGMGEHKMAYNFFGFSVRMCELLNLHVDPRKRARGQVTNEDIATKSWAFWTTYTADVWLSVYMGREFGMDLQQCSIPLPVVEGLPNDELPWVLPGVDETERPNFFRETFVEFSRLTTIATKIINMVYGMDNHGQRRFDQTIVQKVDAELNDWHSNLPEALSSTSFALPHTLMMHLAFWYSIILLHQPSYKASPNTKSTSRKLCHRASRVIADILQQWRDLYSLRLVPVVLLNFVFTAGTTWLIAVSERSHKRSTSEQYLRNAEHCLEMLKEMSPLWESADLLGEMFTKLVNEEREKRRNEEERWMITEVGPGGTLNPSGSVIGPTPRWGVPPESLSGFPVYSGRSGNTPQRTDSGYSRSSEEEGTMAHQPHLHLAQGQTRQYLPPQHHYQPSPLSPQAHNSLSVQQQHSVQQHLPPQSPHWQARTEYSLPPLADPGHSASSVLPRIHTGQTSSIQGDSGMSMSSNLTAIHATDPRLSDNDAINGLIRTGVWQNPSP